MDKDAILERLIKISEDVASLNTKVDAFQATITSHVKEDDDRYEKHSDRITKVEDQQKKVKWMAAGGAAVITALGYLAEVMVGFPVKK